MMSEFPVIYEMRNDFPITKTNILDLIPTSVMTRRLTKSSFEEDDDLDYEI